MNPKELLIKYWNELYPDEPDSLLFRFLDAVRYEYVPADTTTDSEWYKDAVVYSLYVDLFNKDFEGLIHKLDYLQDLGVDCLWLLPILEIGRAHV